MTTQINGKEIPFRQAKFFRACPTGRLVDLVVIHTAVVPAEPGRAKWLMDYCANNDRLASWHYSVDSEEITQSVFQTDIAYHAPGANGHGIGIELATSGSPTAFQWADGYHEAMLKLTADLVADICGRWSLEPIALKATQLQLGMRGITTHREVSEAFKKSDHMDPGPNFPMEYFIALVTAKLKKG